MLNSLIIIKNLQAVILGDQAQVNISSSHNSSKFNFLIWGDAQK